MHIRQATLDDIPNLVALGRLMHQESVYRTYALDVEKLALLLKHLLDEAAGIVLVAESSGAIVGGFVGMVVEHWFGLTKQAVDLALFMEPSHRGGRTAFRLLNAYVEEAKNRGADQIVMANSTGVDMERVADLFEAVGFEKTGYVLAMHVPKGDKQCV